MYLRIHPLSQAACLVVLLVAMGCQPSGTSPAIAPGDRTQDEGPVDQPDSSETPARQVSVEIKTWEEVQQMVAELRGQVVVLDIWSTWCVPCTVEFPHLVKLQESYPAGLTCISVAVNYSGLADEPPESFREEILSFLQRQNAAFPNVISSTPDEALYAAIGTASVPVVLVYGPDGDLKKMFTNDDLQYGDEGFTYADHIIPLVEQLMNPSS